MGMKILSAHLLFILFYFIVINIITINGRSIHEGGVVEDLIDGDKDRHLAATLAAYGYRFRHSETFKNRQWALNEQNYTIFCKPCDLLVPWIRLLIETKQTAFIEDAGIAICIEFKLFDEELCIAGMREYQDAVMKVIAESRLTSKQLCALAFDCERQFDFPVLNWNVTFPTKPKPPPQPPKPPSPESPKLTVLHLTDIHIDFAYQPGSRADCAEPLCCQTGQPTSNQTSAGFWGDYRNCDLPRWTAEAILKHIAENEMIDFIYYTGDLPPQDVWKQSRADQLYAISNINQLLRTTFPNTTFYSAVGNHDAAPCNLFPTPNIRSDNISWLYETLADSWVQLGLPAATRDSILYGAFYTLIIRPGLRLISLNTNYCTGDNYWLFINSTDPLDQLQWLIHWLQYAEDNEEKVHIIGHHPPQACLAAFSWNFNKIVNRYENTISAQFFGHLHNDQFLVYYDELNPKRAVSMGYVTPSLTPYPFLNPGYRIYTFDGVYPGSSFWVLDHRTVIMNLTASNIHNKTIFTEEYNARDTYQMKNLFPQGWNNLIERLENDIDGSLMDLAYTHYTKSYANGTRCNHKCRRQLLCRFKTARSQDPNACDSIPPFLQ